MASLTSKPQAVYERSISGAASSYKSPRASPAGWTCCSSEADAFCAAGISSRVATASEMRPGLAGSGADSALGVLVLSVFFDASADAVLLCAASVPDVRFSWAALDALLPWAAFASALGAPASGFVAAPCTGAAGVSSGSPVAAGSAGSGVTGRSASGAAAQSRPARAREIV